MLGELTLRSRQGGPVRNLEKFLLAATLTQQPPRSSSSGGGALDAELVLRRCWVDSRLDPGNEDEAGPRKAFPRSHNQTGASTLPAGTSTPVCLTPSAQRLVARSRSRLASPWLPVTLAEGSGPAPRRPGPGRFLHYLVGLRFSTANVSALRCRRPKGSLFVSWCCSKATGNPLSLCSNAMVPLLAEGKMPLILILIVKNYNKSLIC